MPNPQILFRLDRALYDEAVKIAAQEGCSVGILARRALIEKISGAPSGARTPDYTRAPGVQSWPSVQVSPVITPPVITPAAPPCPVSRCTGHVVIGEEDGAEIARCSRKGCRYVEIV